MQEEKYDQLKTAYDRSNARTETVRDRLEAVEDVSEALFEEWQNICATRHKDES